MLARSARAGARLAAGRSLARRPRTTALPSVAARNAVAHRCAGLGLGAACGLGVACWAPGALPPARCEAAAPPAPEPSPGEVQAAALAARNRAWWDALGDALDHWASFLGLLVATLVAAAVERVALTGQVQQLMSLPGQLPLDRLLAQLGAVFGVKAVHLIAEAAKGLLGARLGGALEARGRARWLAASKVDAAAGDEVAELAAPEKGLELATASRLLVVDAAPKALVELLFGVAGAAGALYASPPLALFFVGHEAFMAQLVGAVAGALAARRDGAARREESAKEAWAGEVSNGAAYPYADPELRVCHVEAGDAQLVLERAVDAGQLAVLSSYVLASGALIEKRALGIDGDKYQKVMGFAGGFMQAAQEVNGCAEKLGRGTELMALLHKLEDAKKAA